MLFFLSKLEKKKLQVETSKIPDFSNWQICKNWVPDNLNPLGDRLLYLPTKTLKYILSAITSWSPWQCFGHFYSYLILEVFSGMYDHIIHPYIIQAMILISQLSSKLEGRHELSPHFCGVGATLRLCFSIWKCLKSECIPFSCFPCFFKGKSKQQMRNNLSTTQ